MPLSRRVLLTEGSRALAVAGTAVVGLLAARTARPVSDSSLEALQEVDPNLTVPVALQDLLVVPDGDQRVVFSRRCTHLGCRLNVADDGTGFVCPCHGSRFDLQGRRIEGPAERDLAVLTIVQRSADQPR